MSTPTPENSPPSQGWFPAWSISFLFHATAIVLLVMALERAPLGGTANMGGTIDVVLNHTSAPGGSSADEQSPAPVAVPAPPAAPPEPVVIAAPTPQAAIPATTAPAASALAQSSVDPTQAANVEGGSYGPPGDGQAQVKVFGVEGVGKKFVYVFDRSTSMEGAPLSTAKQQLIQSLQSLDNLHQFHIIFFNQQMRNFSAPSSGRRIAFATDRNKQLAAKFVGGITADGGTDRLPALRAAVNMQPDVIFFLTDVDAPMPASELAELERLNQRVGAKICTIEFGRGPRTSTSNFLTQLAQLTGGQYGYVDTLQLKR